MRIDVEWGYSGWLTDDCFPKGMRRIASLRSFELTVKYEWDFLPSVPVLLGNLRIALEDTLFGGPDTKHRETT